MLQLDAWQCADLGDRASIEMWGKLGSDFGLAQGLLRVGITASTCKYIFNFFLDSVECSDQLAQTDYFILDKWFGTYFGCNLTELVL
jgi:hypothetical protein